MMLFRIIISTIIFTLSITGLYGQETKITADSLFENQKFTEAFELYDSLYQSGETSKSILLKMAYIKEGLGDYTNSLIYLNKYYELTTNRKAFDKMTELAQENDLSGYEYSDNKLFISFFRNYKEGIILFLLLLITLCTVTIIYKKRKGEKSVGAIIVQVVLTICLIFLTTDWLLNEEAIILKEQTIVMSGPSAGSEPLLVLKKGHKVEVVEKNQLWVKIKWDNQEAWVRSQQLTFL
ncbi:MAG: SH3 domain-containing protein [Cyclobacteriaceae bacterium]